MICIWSSRCHCHSIISYFIKIQIGLTFLVLAYPGCPGKDAIKWASYYNTKKNNFKNSNKVWLLYVTFGQWPGNGSGLFLQSGARTGHHNIMLASINVTWLFMFMISLQT